MYKLLDKFVHKKWSLKNGALKVFAEFEKNFEIYEDFMPDELYTYVNSAVVAYRDSGKNKDRKRIALDFFKKIEVFATGI